MKNIEKLLSLDLKTIKKILLLALPIILGNLLQITYQLTDLFWIGKIGTNEIAAMSISMPVLFLFYSIGIGVSIAGLILVSQKFGAKATNKINDLSGQMMTIMLSFGTLIGIIGYFATPYLIKLNGAEQTVTNLAIEYTQISFIGIIAVYGMLCFKDILAGIQQLILPLKITALTVIINFFLDPLLIIYFNLGLSGAAYATIFNQFLSFFIACYILKTGKTGIKIHLNHLLPNKKLIKNVLKLAIPSSIELTAISIANYLLIIIISLYSTNVVAGFGIAIQIFNIIIFISIGLLVATSTLIGEQIGSKNKKTAKNIGNNSIKLSAYIGIIYTIICIIFAKQIINFFTTDLQVIQEGTKILQLIAFVFTPFIIQKVTAGIFQGSGNPQIPSVITVISLWLIELPLAYFLSQHTNLQVTGIWFAVIIAGTIGMLISIIIYFKFSWTEKSIIKEH